MSLFPDDRELPADALDSVPVKLRGLEWRRPRVFGNCLLACELGHPLGLGEFGRERWPEAREAVSGEKVWRLLVVNRRLDPGRKFHVPRQWSIDSALDELLGTDFAVAEKDRLYRCLDRVWEHKPDRLVWLRSGSATRERVHSPRKVSLLFAGHISRLLYWIYHSLT